MKVHGGTLETLRRFVPDGEEPDGCRKEYLRWFYEESTWGKPGGCYEGLDPFSLNAWKGWAACWAFGLKYRIEG